MIPKKVLELACEGGWELRGGFVPTGVTALPTGNPSFSLRFEDPDTKKPWHESVGWEEIALDPAFWQALGKQLVWDTVTETDQGFENTWEYNAHRLYDLVLNGLDTEKFWQELLANL